MGLTEDELKSRMLAKVEAALDKLLAHKKVTEEITLTEIEQLVLVAGQEIGEGLTAALVEESVRVGQMPGPACAECGQEMHYKGLKQKRVVSETGEVEVNRAYYYCETCKAGLFPPG
jgi:hypothetical protein